MNEFQIQLLKTMIDILSPTHIGDVAISITKGPIEVFTEVKMLQTDMSFWLYEDGASILGPDVDVRFEAEGFDSEAELTTAFIEGVKSTLGTT